jgi:predicted negative regulator of RcsB-dependent stress response
MEELEKGEKTRALPQAESVVVVVVVVVGVVVYISWRTTSSVSTACPAPAER